LYTVTMARAAIRAVLGAITAKETRITSACLPIANTPAGAIAWALKLC